MRSIAFVLLSLLIMSTCPPADVIAAAPSDKSVQTDRTLDEQLDKIAREIAGSISPQQKWKLAVIEFPEISGQVTNVGRFIAEELTTRLFLTDRFRMIERQLISNVLKEQNLSMTGLLDEKSTKRVGLLLGVDFIVIGTISDLGSNLKINARTIAIDTGAVHSVSSAVLSKDGQMMTLLERREAGATGPKFSSLPPTKKQDQGGRSSASKVVGSLVVKGRLLFDGKPLTDYTKAPAAFRIYSQNLGQWVTPAYEYDSETASFTIQVIAEDSYSCNVEVDANPANPDRYPGDYRGSAHFSVWKSSSPDVKVEMERLIHLSAPQDNSVPMVGWGAACFDKILFAPPVRIAWEPFGNDVSYTYTVSRTECSPFAVKEMVAGDTTKATSVILDLPLNRDGDIYLLQIIARKNGRTVGSLMTHGANGWGWDYRFRAAK